MKTLPTCVLQEERCAEPIRSHQGPALTVEEVESAEKEIHRAAQKVTFSREMGMLKPQDRALAEHKKSDAKTSSLYRLDPFLDHDGVLQVGGRI